MNPVRVFIGSSPDQLDVEAEIALEYAITSRASGPVDLTFMRVSRDPDSPFFSDPQSHSGIDTSQWATPFSGLRWMIPQLCGYRGRAIYMDVDTLPLADMRELFEQPLGAAAWMAKHRQRPCVMLIDCSRFSHLVPFDNTAPLREFPAGQNWNCLDGEGLALGDPSMKCIHFTTIDTQPHLPLAKARLEFCGAAHWLPDPPRKHRRPDLEAAWYDAYVAGLASGLGDPDPHRFGYLPLKSLGHYASRHR